MIQVAICARHQLIVYSLEVLLHSLGFVCVPSEQAEVALWDLTGCHPLPLPPATPAILALVDTEDQALEALKIGYKGYLRATSTYRDLAKALGSVAQGEVWCERHVLYRLAQGDGVPHLTVRERDVLLLVSRGHSNKEIAQKLGIAETTVKGHVSTLLGKLEAKSRAAIIARYRPEGGQAPAIPPLGFARFG